MTIPTDDLDKLSQELRQIADEIAAMKAREITMEHGLGRKRLNSEIKFKQYQALFYMDKIKNLGIEKTGKVKA